MLRATAAFIVLTCLSGMAGAQGLDQPLRPTQTLKITPLTPASAETLGPVLGRGGATATLRSPNAERGVLSSFRLGFMGTDHKVNTLGVLVQGQRAEFILRDRDANDPFRAHAKWLQSPSYSATQEVSAHASGDVKIDLPAGPAGHVALLQGFQFKRARATDANVRLVAVQIAEDSRSVRVALVDDQGADFRGMDGAQSLGLAALPLGELLALPVFGARLTGTLPEFDERRLRTYTVTVQYVWVPPSLVLGDGLVAGTTRMADTGTLRGALLGASRSRHSPRPHSPLQQAGWALGSKTAALDERQAVLRKGLRQACPEEAAGRATSQSPVGGTATEGTRQLAAIKAIEARSTA